MKKAIWKKTDRHVLIGLLLSNFKNWRTATNHMNNHKHYPCLFYHFFIIQ